MTIPLTPITQSMMQTMFRCEEKMRLRYLEKLVPPGPKDAALSIGSAVHFGCETLSADRAVGALIEDRGPVWLEHEAEALETEVAIVRAMVGGALEMWTAWPTQEDREVQFRVPFLNPATGRPSTRHTFEGVFDGVWPAVEAVRDSPVLMEIKTTGRLDAAYLERLDLDWQVSAYMAAASIIYKTRVRDMMYRAIRKPSIKQRKTETVADYAARLAADYLDRPEFYFEEVHVTRTDRQIERWWHEAWELHERILRVENGGMTIRNPSHCLDYGQCKYFNLCRGVVGPSAFRVQEAHPELNRRR